MSEEPKGDAPTAKWPVATVVELRVMGVFPASLYTALQARVDEAASALLKAFVEAGGQDPIVQWAEVRPATREEVLHFQPRKLHFEVGGRQACLTPHVAKRNLTTEREAVTCKLCRAVLGIAG